MTLTPDQIGQLLKPVNGTRVRQRDGNSYMEAHDIKAHLTRIFGFGNYDSEVFQLDLMYERPGKSRSGAEAVSVGYRAGVRLTVRTPEGAMLATYTEYAAAGATNYPVNKLADAHDMAMKSAASYALKRCAIHLGDQFGLSLYNNGSTSAFVGGTLVGAEKPAAPDDVAVADETEPTPNPVQPEQGVSAEAFAPPRFSDDDQRAWLDSVGAQNDLDALQALWRDAQQRGAVAGVPGFQAAVKARKAELLAKHGEAA